MPPNEVNHLDLRVTMLLDAGDCRAAAAETLRTLGPGLLNYLGRVLGDRGEAEEAFSIASERIWRGLPSFRGESALKTWCFRLASNVVADLHKSAWKTRVQRLGTDDAAGPVIGERTASWLRDERLRLTLQGLRAALSLEDQSLLQLRIDQELSWAECAEILSSEGRRMSVEAAMKRFERIKTRLRKLARSRT